MSTDINPQNISRLNWSLGDLEKIQGLEYTYVIARYSFAGGRTGKWGVQEYLNMRGQENHHIVGPCIEPIALWPRIIWGTYGAPISAWKFPHSHKWILKRTQLECIWENMVIGMVWLYVVSTTYKYITVF